MNKSFKPSIWLEEAVSYHPLAVRRRPNLSKQFSEDWQMLAARLNKI